ncbi:MAG: hypothetical protein SGJ02_03805 [bacterium]|nr:hypothetical protein [bacterium]
MHKNINFIKSFFVCIFILTTANDVFALPSFCVPGSPSFPGCLGGFFGGGTYGGSGTDPTIVGPGIKLGKYYRDIINGDFQDSLMDPANEFSGFSITDNIQNNIAAIHLNSGNPCTGDSCSASGNEGAIVPGSRGVPLQALIPGSMKAEADYLWSTDAVNMSQDNLNSPQVVRDVSLFLAESAVAQGEANARAKAANLTSNTMLQNIAFSLATDKFEGSQAAYQTYYWCIQKRLSEGSGFAKAHQICSKDNGRKSANAEGSVGNAPGFKFSDNPGFEADSNENRILLTHILFNEEIATSANPPELIETKAAFKEIYGDIEFSLVDSGGSLGNNYKVKPGSMQPAEAYQRIIIQKFNSLRDIIGRYCNYVNSQGNGTTASPKDYQRIYEKFPGASGIGNVSSDLLKTVSTPGFSMTPAIISGMRFLYASFYLGHENAVPSDDTHMWCAPVENTGQFAVNINADFKTFHQNLKGVGGKTFFQALYHMSRLLALAEWLTRAAVAEQIVEFLSVGIDSGGNIENLAKDLIYRTVGSRDIKFEIERVNAQLREYVMGNFERQETSNSISAQAGANLIQDNSSSQK